MSDIVHALAALRDPQMRLRRVARYLREEDAETAVRAIDAAAALARDDRSRVFYLSVLHLILCIRPRPSLPGGPLPPPDQQDVLGTLRIAALAGAASRAQLRLPADLLRDAFAAPTPLDAVLLKPHPSIEKVALGRRRERARLAGREQWQPLLVDTTPAVVQLLAENPRVTHAQAMEIATLRPQHPFALEALLLSYRWLSDVKIAEAVARNPSTAPWLARALDPLLPRIEQSQLSDLQAQVVEQGEIDP